MVKTYYPAKIISGFEMIMIRTSTPPLAAIRFAWKARP
jgi:hypothetical protein